MKIRTQCLIVLVSLSCAFASQDRRLWVAKEGSIPVWLASEHAADEAPATEAGSSDPLLELDTKESMIKIKTGSGLVGWIDAAKVRPWKKGEGQSIDLGDVKVSGYLDNPNSVYILDDSKDPPEAFQIRRDLTLLVNLEDNFDRETIERKYGENN